MNQIWKYKLNMDQTIIKMPQGSKVLCVQMQRVIPCIWVEVNSNDPEEKRHFEFFGTGHDFDHNITDSKKYIGTIQMCAESLVLHLYETEIK